MCKCNPEHPIESQKPKSSIEKKQDESRLEQLRNQLTEPQRELLDEFWKYYRQNGKWPPTRIVHSHRGKRMVRECLKGLGGDIVTEDQDSNSGRHYKLTIIGVLLTDEGRKYFAMLVQYMEFLRKQYKEAPERLDFSHEDFREALKLSNEQLQTLGELVRLGHLWAGGGCGKDSWSVRPPDEIEDMPDDGPLDESLEDLLFQRFQSGKPVSMEDRQRQIPNELFFDPIRANNEVVMPGTGTVLDVLKRRYQVFVSSTYRDLQEERQHVIQALLETKCIPVGMELFPAASVEQWELIKRVIEECDYYFVIIAGRYGSVDQSGIGYTEKEYDYALSIGKPILGFYHRDPNSLPGEKLEENDEGRERLKTFTEKIKKKLCRQWDSAAGLGSAVKSAILHELEYNPKPGWIRADQVQNSPEIERLKQRIADLEEERRNWGMVRSAL